MFSWTFDEHRQGATPGVLRACQAANSGRSSDCLYIGSVQSGNLRVLEGVRTIRKSPTCMHQGILIKKLNLSWV